MSNTKIYPLPKRWGGDPICGGGEGKTHLFALRQRIEVYGNDLFQFRGWASLLKKSCLEPCLKPHPSTKLHHERATASVSLFFKKKNASIIDEASFFGFFSQVHALFAHGNSLFSSSCSITINPAPAPTEHSSPNGGYQWTHGPKD